MQKSGWEFVKHNHLSHIHLRKLAVNLDISPSRLKSYMTYYDYQILSEIIKHDVSGGEHLQRHLLHNVFLTEKSCLKITVLKTFDLSESVF